MPEDFIVKEDMICPVNKIHCDDECCTVGSVCNVSGNSEKIGYPAEVEPPEKYMTPRDIMMETGIGVESLRKYRQKGILKKIKWTAGGGKPYYEINEVKKLFHKN